MIAVNNADCEMKMPARYVDMPKTELVYDGGWSWSKFCTIAAIAGLGVVALGGAGVVSGVVLRSGVLARAGLYAIGAGTLTTVGSLGGLLGTSSPDDESKSSGPA